MVPLGVSRWVGGDLCVPLVDAFGGSTNLLPPPARDEKGEQAAVWERGKGG